MELKIVYCIVLSPEAFSHQSLQWCSNVPNFVSNFKLWPEFCPRTGRELTMLRFPDP